MEYNSNIENLIERYFEGETTLDEEQQIASYLSQCKELTPELQALKLMFESAAHTRERCAPQPTPQPQRVPRRTMWLRYSTTAVAACIVIAFAIHLFLPFSHKEPHTQSDIVCYIDGELVANNYASRAEATRLLNSVNSDLREAMAKIEGLKIL
jgi:hypothetical protein